MFAKSRMTIWIVIASATMVTGCANLNSISRSSTVKPSIGAKVLTVDAKQRHLYFTPDVTEGNDVKWRVCAEAAPDVFSALASSGALSVDISASQSGEAGFSMAETAATIQRTQSINLIRESFYRTCERFASGAISSPQFIVQAARDQRAMISILAIEQLTGAVRPPATILSGPATQASALAGEEAANLVRDYRERRDKAEATYKTANLAYDAAQKDDGPCAGSDAEKCAEFKFAADNAKKELDSAQAGLDNSMAVAKSLVSSASSSTLAGTNSTSGLTMSDIGAANLQAVADAVIDIHRAAVINEPMMFCIAWLTSKPDENVISQDVDLRGEIASGCMGILTEAARAERQYLTEWALSEEDSRPLVVLATESKNFHKQLAARIRKTGAGDLASKLKLFESRAGANYRIDKSCAKLTPVKCADFLESRDIYASMFQNGQGDKLQDAFANWDVPAE